MNRYEEDQICNELMVEKEEVLTEVEEDDVIPYEFAVRDNLVEQRKQIKTFEDLTSFIKDVEEHYNCGYGAAPRAIAQAALAVAWYLSSKFGITGFQAGVTMWDFITGWNCLNNKCGLKLVDYDNMLYPQYYHKFNKTISSDTWEALQKQAKENLVSSEYASQSVRTHWKNITDGVVPFGYTVIED